MNFRHDAGLFADRDQMKDGLGVRGRGKDGAALLQFALNGQGVGDVAIVGDGEAAAGKFGEKRLDVAQAFATGGRIAGVADCAVAGQAVHDRALGEGVANQADMALDRELLAVERDDAGCFLAAVLQCMQPEGDDGCGVLLAENAKHPAFIVKAIGFAFGRVHVSAVQAGAVQVSVRGSSVCHVVGPFPTGRPE
jgi:hypothetical protein